MSNYSLDNTEIKIVCPKYVHQVMKRPNVENFNIFQYNTKEEIIYKRGDVVDELAWTGFTHDYTISYCIHKGFKNIILIGVADFIDGPHYSRPNDKFVYSSHIRIKSQNFIKHCNEIVNIYTCNPESSLEIPKIDIKELLN